MISLINDEPEDGKIDVQFAMMQWKEIPSCA
jgi:hypothetical protein